MRVLIWSELFWPYIGGAELFVARLMLALRERGYEPLVITSHDALHLPDEASYRGIPVRRFHLRHALKGRDLDELLKARRATLRCAQDFAPDVVLMNGVSPSALFCLAAAQICSAPLLLRLNSEPRHAPKRVDTLFRKLLQQASWVSPVSMATLEQAREIVPSLEGRSSVIRQGVDCGAHPPSPPSMDPPRLLCVGRLVHIKGFDLVLDAFASVRRRWPRARLAIAGDGTEREALAAQAQALGIESAVDLLGWVDPSEVPRLISECSLVIIASRTEGLPAVALQVAAAGRPVVATSVGGVAEIVEHGETGFLVAADASDIAAAVSCLLDQPTLAARLGAAAWQRARQGFSEERCVDAYDALLRQLAAADPCPASKASGEEVP